MNQTLQLGVTQVEEAKLADLCRRYGVKELSLFGSAVRNEMRPGSDLTSRHPEAPWPQIAAFRNILIHAYFGIDWDVVWRAATNRCPVLRGQIADILVADFGTPDGLITE